jgi:hypothetical protein
LPDATQKSIYRSVGEHEAIALKPHVEKIRLFKHLQIDFAKLEFLPHGRRRGFDGRSLLLRERERTN